MEISISNSIITKSHFWRPNFRQSYELSDRAYVVGNYRGIS